MTPRRDRGRAARMRGATTCRARMRGAVSVLMAVLIGTVALAALLSIDIGHLFYRQRQLQAVADLAALAAAQQLRRADGIDSVRERALAAADAAAAQNGYGAARRADCAPAAGEDDGMALCVGVWDPRYDTPADGQRHFRDVFDPAQLSPNAVRVVATYTVPILFGLPGGGGRQLRAEAIATASPPVAAFSVGSGLADFDSARSALGLLLGHGIQLSALDWQGLVAARVTLEQLRARAGVGSVDELMRTTLSLSDFYALVLGAADRGTLLAVLVGGLPASADQVALAAGLSVGRVVELGVLAPSASSAADVGLSVAELLMLAAQVANAGSALDLSASIPLLPGARLVADIGDPPRMAVGPVQQLSADPVRWKTTARTSQAGLALSLPLGVSTSVAGVGVLTGTADLSLRVEAAQAQSSLTALRCAADPADRRATLATNTRIASVCLADKADLGRCATGEVKLAELSGLGIAKAVLTASPQRTDRALNPVSSTLAPGATTTASSPQQLTMLVQDVASNLDVKLQVELLGLSAITLPLKLGALIGTLGTAIATLLNPAIDSALGLLGIQLGAADLWVHDVDCDNTNLVY